MHLLHSLSVLHFRFLPLGFCVSSSLTPFVGPHPFHDHSIHLHFHTFFLLPFHFTHAFTFVGEIHIFPFHSIFVFTYPFYSIYILFCTHFVSHSHILHFYFDFHTFTLSHIFILSFNWRRTNDRRRKRKKAEGRKEGRLFLPFAYPSVLRFHLRCSFVRLLCLRCTCRFHCRARVMMMDNAGNGYFCRYVYYIHPFATAFAFLLLILPLLRYDFSRTFTLSIPFLFLRLPFAFLHFITCIPLPSHFPVCLCFYHISIFRSFIHFTFVAFLFFFSYITTLRCVFPSICICIYTICICIYYLLFIHSFGFICCCAFIHYIVGCIFMPSRFTTYHPLPLSIATAFLHLHFLHFCLHIFTGAGLGWGSLSIACICGGGSTLSILSTLFVYFVFDQTDGTFTVWEF